MLSVLHERIVRKGIPSHWSSCTEAARTENKVRARDLQEVRRKRWLMKKMSAYLAIPPPLPFSRAWMHSVDQCNYYLVHHFRQPCNCHPAAAASQLLPTVPPVVSLPSSCAQLILPAHGIKPDLLLLIDSTCHPRDTHTDKQSNDNIKRTWVVHPPPKSHPLFMGLFIQFGGIPKLVFQKSRGTHPPILLPWLCHCTPTKHIEGLKQFCIQF